MTDGTQPDSLELSPQHTISWRNLVSDSSTFSTAVQQVIGQAATDPTFRAALFQHPEKTFSTFNLTDQDLKLLQHLDRKQFESVVEMLQAELATIVSQYSRKEEQIAELAEAWEASLREIDLGDNGGDANTSDGEAVQL